MSWLDMLLNESERAARLRSDLPYFAEHCLKLRPKAGSLAPFVFNPAQLELHRRIEEQKAKTGRVRVIILKARQLGGRLLIESKQDMRKRGVPSPDEADAVALCFSEPGGVGHVRNANFSRDLRETYANSYQ